MTTSSAAGIRGNGIGRQGAPTDLFCTIHQRLLPLVNGWSNRARVSGLIVAATGICAGFTLAAQTNSLMPVWIVYALLGLAFVVLPLRHFMVGPQRSGRAGTNSATIDPGQP